MYGLKQAFDQWYHKFYQAILSFDFEVNLIDDYRYHKFSGSKIIFFGFVCRWYLASNERYMHVECNQEISIKEFWDERLIAFVLGIDTLW